MVVYSEEENEYIAKRVYSFVESGQVTIRELSDIVFVSYKTMQRMIHGESNFDDGRLDRIADYLGKEKEYFLPPGISGGSEIRSGENKLTYSNFLSSKIIMKNYLEGLSREDRKEEIKDIATEFVAYLFETTEDN